MKFRAARTCFVGRDEPSRAHHAAVRAQDARVRRRKRRLRTSIAPLWAQATAALVAGAALAVSGTGAVSAAGAATAGTQTSAAGGGAAGAPGNAGKPSSGLAEVALRNCRPALARATFVARMRAVPGAAQLGIRLQLQERALAGDGRWRTVRLASSRWRWSKPGVPAFVLERTYRNLRHGARYRVRADFAWRDARGQTLRQQSERSGACVLPQLLPNLRPVAISWGPAVGGYRLVVRNTGAAAAPPAVVAISVGAWSKRVTLPPLAPHSSTELRVDGPLCLEGTSVAVAVDPDGLITESDESDNSLRRVCPVQAGVRRG